MYHLVGKALVGMGQVKESYVYFEAAHRLDPSDEITEDFTFVVELLN